MKTLAVGILVYCAIFGWALFRNGYMSAGVAVLTPAIISLLAAFVALFFKKA